MYCDFSFYESVFGGSLVSEPEFESLERKAELYVDAITFDRLTDWFPVNQKHALKVKNTVCMVVDELKRSANLEKIRNDITGKISSSEGVISSKSSGNESVSFESTSTMMGAIEKADGKDVDEKIYTIVSRGLTGVTKDGINILYAGIER